MAELHGGIHGGTSCIDPVTALYKASYGGYGPSTYNWYLEDHPRTCKWLGSPLFTSHEVRPFINKITPFRRLAITMVINHLQVLG